jgi:acetylornithine/succinyldiaminopimelate/putrescine aminotransferase
VEQAQRLTLSSRAFHNDKFPIFAKMLTTMFGYEMVLPMNTGAEGVETALKLARKWGYEKKGIAKDEVCYLQRKYLVFRDGLHSTCESISTDGFLI